MCCRRRLVVLFGQEEVLLSAFVQTAQSKSKAIVYVFLGVVELANLLVPQCHFETTLVDLYHAVV